MINIRDFTEADLEQVLDLHVSVMKHAGVYKGDGPWDDDLKDIKNAYLYNNGVFLIGEADGKIVAMGAFKKSDNGLAEIKRMRVIPELQGKGYGRLMFIMLEKRAIQMGYRGFHLETSELQLAAQKLYLKCGFEEVGRCVIDGYNCILYEKMFI
ncbi:MAG: GNAT family N-acetyltransferase [Clostridia bacterium]|nr:GNAT family N-acetyltransferase [Clostridia bacterium]